MINTEWDTMAIMLLTYCVVFFVCRIIGFNAIPEIILGVGAAMCYIIAGFKGD